MKILDNIETWYEDYCNTWLDNFNQNGKVDWKIYPLAENSSSPNGSGVDISISRLLFISSAGGYHKDNQKPFDAANDLGDYSIRTFPLNTPFEKIDYAHDHYDQTNIKKDPQVLIPLKHLEDLVNKGKIGDVTSTVINFMGYQPNVKKVVEEMIPEILELAVSERVDSALLVPS